MNRLAEIVRDTGTIPLSWAGSTQKMHYLNFGDALSPVMVALCTGRHIERIPFRSSSPRLGAVGTVGHAFEKGEVWFWGTGCSNHKNPGAPSPERIPYTPPTDATFHINATRGPISGGLLAGGGTGSGVYGDPVWLLPRFYNPPVEKRWDLGIILHLSELSDRSFSVHPNPAYHRYDIPAEFADSVHLINTVTPIDVDALRLKLDEILACRRILSTSLHGMVIAESYGIPCLSFAPAGAQPGLVTSPLLPHGRLDLRIVDLYQGLGRSRLPIYVQPRNLPTDWAAAMDAIDRAWAPVELRSEDDLINALPIDPAPIAPPATGSVFDLPLLKGLQLQHDVGQLGREERLRNKAGSNATSVVAAPAVAGAEPVPPEPPNPVEAAPAVPGRARAPAPSALQAPVIRTGLGQPLLDPEQLLVALNRDGFVVPLAWAATTPSNPLANLGDALSPVVVATMAGLPIRRRNFDQDAPRLVAVGTIGHAQRNGTAHFWGTGFDAKRHPQDPGAGAYGLPTNTDLVVHALRGPRSGALLRGQGVTVPEIFGDPIWFIDRLVEKPEPTHELGIVIHLTELAGDELTAGPRPNLKRYDIPDALANSIRIINTRSEATVGGLFDKVREIASCKRIVSTSLHGLVIAETYGIPCAWFGTYPGGPSMLDIERERVDHRIQDFYLGAGRRQLPAYCQDRSKPSPWEEIITWLDRSWQPLDYDPSALFDAFPLPKAVALEDRRWTPPSHILDTIPF